MSDFHPFYHQAVQRLLEHDKRDVLPSHSERLASLDMYMQQDDEFQTDVIEMPDEGLDHMG